MDAALTVALATMSALGRKNAQRTAAHSALMAERIRVRRAKAKATRKQQAITRRSKG